MSHALLIDGENVSSRHAARILSEIPADCAVRRVYGDVTRLNGWTKVPELAVHHVPPGKNATDMVMSIDATALAYGQAIAGFTIVTRDVDYHAVVRHLREAGRTVTVISEGLPPERLRAAAHAVIVLPVAQPTVQPTVPETMIEPAAPAQPKTSALLDPVEIIARWIGTGAMPMADLSRRLQKERPRDLSEWLGTGGPRSFLAKHPDRFVMDRTGPEPTVRVAVRSCPTPP